jgi:hypothetical protein
MAPRLALSSKINTHTSNSQQYPSVTSLADGGFVVTWMSSSQDGSGWGIYGQRYAADGSASGAEFQDQHPHLKYQQYPSVTSLADGGFVVTWMSNNQDGSGWGVSTASVMLPMAPLLALSSRSTPTRQVTNNIPV